LVDRAGACFGADRALLQQAVPGRHVNLGIRVKPIDRNAVAVQARYGEFPERSGAQPAHSPRSEQRLIWGAEQMCSDVTLTGDTALYSSTENRLLRKISDLACAQAGLFGLLHGYTQLM
jgi:hypothetical protein